MSPATPDPHRPDDGAETGTGDGDAGRSATLPTHPTGPEPPRPPATAPDGTQPDASRPAGTQPNGLAPLDGAYQRAAYPGMAYPGGFGPVATPRPARRPGRALAVAAGTALALVVLGVPLGLLWHALAPAAPMFKGEGGVSPAQSEALVAADGWFSLLGLGFGLLAAIVIWLVLRRHRGPLGLVAVGLGTLGAGVVAWRVGRQIGLDSYRHVLASAPLDTIVNRPPDLRAGRFEWLYGFVPTLQGNLLLPAFGAIVMYTLLAGWSRWPSLRPEPEPSFHPEPSAPPEAEPALRPEAGPPVSWGSAGPPAPPAAPAPPEPGAAEPPRG